MKKTIILGDIETQSLCSNIPPSDISECIVLGGGRSFGKTSFMIEDFERKLKIKELEGKPITIQLEGDFDSNYHARIIELLKNCDVPIVVISDHVPSLGSISEIENRRRFGTIGHVNHGKTTLTDKINYGIDWGDSEGDFSVMSTFKNGLIQDSKRMERGMSISNVSPFDSFIPKPKKIKTKLSIKERFRIATLNKLLTLNK